MLERGSGGGRVLGVGPGVRSMRPPSLSRAWSGSRLNAMTWSPRSSIARDRTAADDSGRAGHRYSHDCCSTASESSHECHYNKLLQLSATSSTMPVHARYRTSLPVSGLSDHSAGGATGVPGGHPADVGGSPRLSVPGAAARRAPPVRRARRRARARGDAADARRGCRSGAAIDRAGAEAMCRRPRRSSQGLHGAAPTCRR